MRDFLAITRGMNLVAKVSVGRLAVIGALYVITMIFAPIGQGQESVDTSDGSFPVQESSVEVNGIDLHYRLVGEGSPVLLLHGFFASGVWWNSLIEDLAKGNTLIIPDLPAHGRSSRHNGPYLFAQAAQDIFALMDHLRINEFNAIGHSAGGAILLHMGTQKPNRLKAMILVSSAHRMSDEARDIFSEWQVLDQNSLELQAYWQQIHPGGDKQIRSLIDDMRGLSKYSGNELTADQLFEITARTLVVVGDGDPFVPLDLAVELRQAILDSNLWVIPSQGHVPIWPDWGGSPYSRTIFPTIANEFLHGSN